MNKVWNELLKFETNDLVDRFVTTRHGRKLNKNRILQITSNFIQGREYFKSSEIASITVRPLLQYYGVMALSKGLILSLDLSKTEENLKSSHGLSIKNWNQILKKKEFENIEVSIGDGTFSELIKVTENKNYLRANTSEINWSSFLNPPLKGDIILLKKLIQYFPDLSEEYNSWLEEKLYFAVVQEINTNGDDNKIFIKLEGQVDIQTSDLLFPQDYCKKKTIEAGYNSTIIKYDKCNWYPNITQRWNSVFGVGDACVIPTLPNDIGLNLLSGMYMISYVFGMMARYFPATWISLKRVEKGDKIYPFVYRILDFVDDKFPQLVLDFLNTHDFENK
jgi:hypothetical protein